MDLIGHAAGRRPGQGSGQSKVGRERRRAGATAGRRSETRGAGAAGWSEAKATTVGRAPALGTTGAPGRRLDALDGRFGVAGAVVGPVGAWWLGFAVYWLVFGIGVPVGLLGRAGVRRVLTARGRPPRLADVVLLAGPPVGAAVGGWLPLSEVSVGLVAVAVGFAVVNGTCEELLWRGVPLALEAGSRVWGVVVPSFAFGVWHVAPWAANPTAGSPLPLMASAVVLGVVYALLARRTRILRWVVASHVLVNLLALNTYATLTWTMTPDR